MKECQCCLSPTPEATSICDVCGYDFEKKCITDARMLRQRVKQLKHAKDWISEVELKRRVHEIHTKNSTRWRFRISEDGWLEVGGRKWTFRSAAKLFNEQKSQIHTDLALAEALLQYPGFTWSDCPNKKQAIETKDEFDLLGVPPFFISESDLQKYIEGNWKTISVFREWNLTGSAVKIQGGEIDLLAHHRVNEKWLILELKKGLADDKTVGQVLRYIGAAKRDIAKDHEDVEGLIIAAGASKGLKDSMPIAPTINFMAYFMEKGKLDFLPAPFAFSSFFLRLIRLHGFDDAIEQLSKITQQTDSEE